MWFLPRGVIRPARGKRLVTVADKHSMIANPTSFHHFFGDSESRSMPFNVGFLLFPEITQLDLIGPYEVFIRLPDARVHLVAKTLDPVQSSAGVRILPVTTMADCPALDLVCVPGGAGMNPLLDDAETLAFLRLQGMEARYITSVCSGA
jgi:cyclohexyl-isocyanide hydratase